MFENFENMTYTVEDNIGYIVLNNKQNNKMNKQFFSEFREIVEYCRNDNVKAIIITGKARHYSVGVDVEELEEQIRKETMVDENNQILQLPQNHVEDKKAFIKLSEINVPVISIIRGFCIGSGFELALNSHIRICEKGAKLGSPESTFGFMPALGGCVQAIHIGGFTNAMEVVCTGEIYSAEEIFRLGLVDIVVEKKTGMNIAHELLKYIFSKGKEYSKDLAVEMVKEFKLKYSF